MKSWVRKALSVGVLAAGAVLFAPGAAQADTAQVSAGNNGVLNGTQVFVPVQVPINVCGNGIGAVLGFGIGVNGICANGAAQDVHAADDWKTYDDRKTIKIAPKQHQRAAATESIAVDRTEDTFQGSFDNDGVLNGTQVFVPVQVPINLCGNGIGAVLGFGIGSNGICANGAAQTVQGGGHRESSPRTEDTAQVSSDNDGLLNGTQIFVPVQVPINVCGNAIAILGIASGNNGGCFNGAAQSVQGGDHGGGHRESSPRAEDTAQVSSDNDGVLNGTQVFVPVQVPINLCGNGIGAVLGFGLGSNGACVNGAAQDVGGDDHGWDHDDHGGYGHDRDGDRGDDGYDHYDHRKAKEGVTKADTETLPLVGDLGVPVMLLGSGMGMNPLASQKVGSDVPALGALRTSKVNIAGVNPVSLLAQQG